MKKEMLINVLQPEECRIAILENGILEELYVERTGHESYVGNIYKGRIVNIEPSIQAAFVDFGVGRNGFLHVSDVEPTYWRDVEPRRNGDRDRGGREGDRDRGRGGDRGGRDRGDRGGRDRNDRDRGRDREREPERDRPAETAQPIAPPPARVQQSPPPVPEVGGFAAGIELDNEAAVQAESSHRSRREPAEFNDVPESVSAPGELEDDKSSLTAHPETRIDEEASRGRRRSRGTGAPAPRRRRSPGGESAGTEEAPPAPVENPPEEEPRPRLMDSAERRTEKPSGPESAHELNPSEGGSGDTEFFFPPSGPFSSEDSAPPSGPGAYAPMVEEPAPEEIAPRPPERERNSRGRGDRGDRDRSRRQRPAADHLDIEDALEADLAEAETGPDGNRVVAPLPEGAVPREPDDDADTVAPARRRESRGEGRGDSRGGDRGRDRGRSGDRGGDRGRERGRPSGDRGGDRGRERGGDRGPAPGPGMDRGRAGVYRPPIQEIFKRGQEVVVQVIKEGIGSKGPTLSTYISIPGRYLVLMPCLNRTGVSRKIDDDDARRRLRQMFNELKPPRGLGFIMRTAAIDKNKNEVQRDLVYLCRLWQVVARRIKKLKGPCEIYQESEMVTRTIRDNFSSDIDTIWVDEKAAFEAAQEFMQGVMPRFADRIKFYEDKEPLFHKFKLEDEIHRIQQKKVPLPHGGSIVIEQTEALVAIDVNSGNFRADNNAEETAYQMNMHAAKEIGRQLRLRDLGGVIVNDFIDMREERHRRAVEKALRDALHRDRARTKILRISQFGIIEMTRQRIRPSLKRSGYMDCPCCKSNGMVKTPETMAIEVMRLVQLASCREEIARIEVSVPVEVADFLLNKARRAIVQCEELGQMTVTIRGVANASGEHVEMRCLDRSDNEVRLTEPEPLPYRGPRITR